MKLPKFLRPLKVRVERLVMPRRQVGMQNEINRLRKVLHEIADTRPDEHLDIEHTPELTEWVCDTCTKARVGAYPHNENGDSCGK